MERYDILKAAAGGGGGGAVAGIETRPETFFPNRSSFTTIPPKPTHALPPYLRASGNPRKPPAQLADDTEISIFEAVRYFNDEPIKQTIFLGSNGGGGDLSTITRDSSVSSAEGAAAYGRGGAWRYAAGATPTPSSEASWNSQSGLLTNIPGSGGRSSQPCELRKAGSFSGGRRRAVFCPCAGKKSIDVEEKYDELKTPNHLHAAAAGYEPRWPASPLIQSRRFVAAGHGRAAELGVVAEEETKMKISAGEKGIFHGSSRFSPERHRFSSELGGGIVKPGNGGIGATAASFSFPILKPQITSMEDPKRDSLEVFLQPSSELGSLRKSAEFLRRGAAATEDDVGSDTSSDLFEIESFSAAAAAAAAARMQRSLVEQSEWGYAASEASVEWSVTTAEGFAGNISSAASDVGGEAARLARAEHERLASSLHGGGGAGAGAGKRKGGLLSSCVCEKAVSVGPVPVQCGRSSGGGAGGGLDRSNSARMSRPVPARS